MKDVLCTMIFVLSISFLQGQELVYEYSLEKFDRGDTYPIFSSNDDKFALLIKDNSKLNLAVFDSVMTLLLTTILDYDGSEYPIYLGSLFTDENIAIHFTNLKRNKIYRKNFSLKTFDFTFFDEYNIPEKEKIVTSFIYKDELAVVTTQKRKSEINMFFYSGSDFRMIEYDLSDEWAVSNNYKYPIEKFLDPEKHLSKIDTDDPFDFFKTAKKTKLYHIKDEVIISMDQSPTTTKLLTLNLKDGSCELSDILHKNVEYDIDIKSNSFIYNDLLFIFSMQNKVWSFLVYNYKSKEYINEIIINKKELANITNSEIIEKYVATYIDYSNCKFIPLESKKHFRKISRFDPFLFTTGTNKQSIEFMLGGCQFKKDEYYSAGPFGRSFMLDTSLEEDFTVICLSSALNAETYEPITQIESDNTFVKVIKYLAEIENKAEKRGERSVQLNHLYAQKIFSFRNDIFLGYYFAEEGKYFLYKFKGN